MAKTKQVPEKKRPEPSNAQLIYEKVLGFGTLFLILMHMVLALTRYVIDVSLFRPFESWYLVVLIAAALCYPLLCLILWRGTLPRIGKFLKKLCSPAQIFCVLLFVWYIVVCWINQNEFDTPYFQLNDWWLLDTFVNCLIIFSLPRVLSEEKAKKYIHILLHIIALCGTAIAVYALRCLFTLNVVTLPGGGQIGMSEGEMFYIGAHYNICAAIELSLVLLCLYMLASQNWLLKIPYAAALLVHIYVLYLNNSRTAFVACMCSCALAVFLALWNVLYGKKTLLRWAAGFAGAAAAVGILWVMRPQAFQLFEDVTHFSELLDARKSGRIPLLDGAALTVPWVLQNAPQITGLLSSSLLPILPVKKWNGKKTKWLLGIMAALLVFSFGFSLLPGQPAGERSALQVEVQQPSVTNAFYTQDGSILIHQADNEGEKAIRKLSDPLNRERVWQSAINVLKSGPHFFFIGVTPVGVSVALQELGGLNFEAAHAHNELLQMAVAMGVPMMVLFAAFMIYMTVKSVRLGMIEGREHFRGAYMVPVMFAGLAVLTLAEAYLFGYFCIMSSLFFLFCGWMNALTEGEG